MSEKSNSKTKAEYFLLHFFLKKKIVVYGTQVGEPLKKPERVNGKEWSHRPGWR